MLVKSFLLACISFATVNGKNMFKISEVTIET